LSLLDREDTSALRAGSCPTRCSLPRCTPATGSSGGAISDGGGLDGARIDHFRANVDRSNERCGAAATPCTAPARGGDLSTVQEPKGSPGAAGEQVLSACGGNASGGDGDLPAGPRHVRRLAASAVSASMLGCDSGLPLCERGGPELSPWNGAQVQDD